MQIIFLVKRKVVNNMSFVDNELFDDVIVGEYRDDDGKVIKNVYTTKDDAALVIGLSTFENLLAKSKSGVGRSYTYMTFDEAEAMYGEEIRAKYREKLKAKREAKLKAQQEAQKANPQPQTAQVEQKPTEEMLQQKEEERKEKIRNSMKDIAERNHCKIFYEMSRGSTKDDIAKKLGLSLPTINKAAKIFRTEVTVKATNEKTGIVTEKKMDYVDYLFNKYKPLFNTLEDSLSYMAQFRRMSTTYKDFSLIKDKFGEPVRPYSYKIYQQELAKEKARVEAEAQKRVDWHNQVQAEADKASEEYMSTFDDRLAEFGVTRTPEKPVAKLNKDGDEIADIDLILSRFSGVASTPASASIETPDTSADVNSYIEKMKELQRKADRREQILPTKQEVYVDDSEADD